MSEQGTQEFFLRSMARNYAGGHQWDDLDGKTCIMAADEIASLRTQLDRAKEDHASCTESWHRVMNNQLALGKRFARLEVQLASARKALEEIAASVKISKLRDSELGCMVTQIARTALTSALRENEK